MGRNVHGHTQEISHADCVFGNEGKALSYVEKEREVLQRGKTTRITRPRPNTIPSVTISGRHLDWQ